jgi:hypothetical protein
LGDAAAFPTLLQLPGFRLLISSFVSVIWFLPFWFLFWGVPRRHAFARRNEFLILFMDLW